MLRCNADGSAGAERPDAVLTRAFDTDCVALSNVSLCATTEEPDRVCSKVGHTENVPVLGCASTVAQQHLCINVTRPEMCLRREHIARIGGRSVVSVRVNGGGLTAGSGHNLHRHIVQKRCRTYVREHHCLAGIECVG